MGILGTHIGSALLGVLITYLINTIWHGIKNSRSRAALPQNERVDLEAGEKIAVFTEEVMKLGGGNSVCVDKTALKTAVLPLVNHNRDIPFERVPVKFVVECVRKHTPYVCWGEKNSLVILTDKHRTAISTGKTTEIAVQNLTAKDMAEAGLVPKYL